MKFRTTKPQETRELKAVLHNDLLYVDDGKGHILFTSDRGVQKPSLHYKNLSDVSSLCDAQPLYEGDILEVTF